MEKARVLRRGLDYQAVEAAMRMLGVSETRDCLLRVQVCEQETLKVFGERSG